MTVTDETRHALYGRLEEVLGHDHATTLMGHLPPVGWADVATKQDINDVRKDIDQLRTDTKRDLGHLQQQIEARIDRTGFRFDSLDARFEGIDTRFDSLDARFEGIDTRFTALDPRFEGIDTRFDSLDARFEGIDTRFTALDPRFEGIDTRFTALDPRFQAIDERFSQVLERIDKRFYELRGEFQQMLMRSTIAFVTVATAVAGLIVGLD